MRPPSSTHWPLECNLRGFDPNDRRPLIAHVIHRLGIGGLEHGLVTLINRMPARYRHAVICMSEFTGYAARIERPDVPLFALHKGPGLAPGDLRRLWALLRRLRPSILHTRNLGPLEAQWVGWAARVPRRIHSMHGVNHPSELTSARYNAFRKATRLLVDHYITVTQDLADWLVETIGVDRARVTRIYNGVNVERFHPPGAEPRSIGPEGFAGTDSVVIGSVMRLVDIKDPLNLVEAFLALRARRPHDWDRLRLAIIGGGPLRDACLAALQTADAARLAWLPGDRDDIPELMRAMDIFVLPSIREGASNTILEAMATGLPVVATRVGGNAELVEEGRTALLPPPRDPPALASALEQYLDDPELRRSHGAYARQRAERVFSIEAMVSAYTGVYDRVLSS